MNVYGRTCLYPHHLAMSDAQSVIDVCDRNIHPIDHEALNVLNCSDTLQTQAVKLRVRIESVERKKVFCGLLSNPRKCPLRTKDPLRILMSLRRTKG